MKHDNDSLNIEKCDIKFNHKRLRQILQIVGSSLSLVLFFWLLRDQNWQMIWQNIRQFPLWLLSICFGLVFSGMIFNAVRWHVLLSSRDVNIPFGEVVRTVFAGAFASNFLPSTIGGDAVRIVSVMRFTSDYVLSFTLVIVDRGMNIAATFTFLPFSWITFGERIFEMIGSQSYSFLFAGALPLKNRLPMFIKRIFRRFLNTFSAWLHQPMAMLKAFIISWISVFVIYLSFWLLARSLGIPVTLVQLAGIEFIVYVVTLVPVSFNGYGVREVIFTSLLMQMGATLEQSAILTLLSRFFLVLTTLPGAFWLSQIMTFSSNSPSDP